MKTAAVLNGVSGAQSAERVAAAVQAETQNLKSCRDRLASLGKASGPEKARAKEHSQKVIGAPQSMQQATASAVAKIRAGQCGVEPGKHLAEAARDYGQAMIDSGQQAGSLLD
jgi:hypothetical protein